MFLLIDIGNTHVRIGTASGLATSPDAAQFLTTDVRAWSSEIRVQLTDVDAAAIGIASVVPDATRMMIETIEDAGGGDLLMVGPGVELPFTMGYATPATLGPDRIAAAAGLVAMNDGNGAPRPLIGIDVGTAVTFEVIDRKRVYLGGPIAPGPSLMAASLEGGTARLPKVPLSFPQNVIGSSTTEALQAGVMLGSVAMISGLLDQILAKVGSDALVVLTGGWGPAMRDRLKQVDLLARDLVLKGIASLLTLNRKRPDRN